MEKVVLYVGLTDEENKALNSEEIDSTLTKRTTELMDYADSLNYEIVRIYRDGYFIGNKEDRPNFNKMVNELTKNSINIVLATYNEVITEVSEKLDNFISKLNKIDVKFKSISKLLQDDTVSNRRNIQLKELMDNSNLEYVSSSIITLLNLDITNDEKFLNPNFEIQKRLSHVKEIYNAEYSWYGKKVVLYVRLSDEDKDKKTPEELSESIKNQLSMLLKHAKANRWVVVAIFCDEDYSGVDNDRPEYNKL